MARKRIIDTLRKKFPDLTWKYEFPSRWVSSAGWAIQAYAVMSRCCMDPCDHYHTEYRRDDTHEVVYGLEHGAVLFA